MQDCFHFFTAMRTLNRYKYYFLMITILLFAACGSRESKFSFLPPDPIILAFGDSLTYGSGATRQESYPAVLQTLLGRKVISQGVPGEFTRMGIKRLPGILEKYHPDILILCEGGNDLIRNLDHKVIKDNLRTMILSAKETGIWVVLIGVPKPGILVRVPDFYRELAKEFHIPYEGKVLADVLSNAAYKSDTIHPNAEAYKIMAEAVYTLLKKSGVD